MIRLQRYLAVTALLCSGGLGAAHAADMTPLLANGPERSIAQERANKAIGLLFHRTLFAEGEPGEHATGEQEKEIREVHRLLLAGPGEARYGQGWTTGGSRSRD